MRIHSASSSERALYQTFFGALRLLLILAVFFSEQAESFSVDGPFSSSFSRIHHHIQPTQHERRRTLPRRNLFFKVPGVDQTTAKAPLRIAPAIYDGLSQGSLSLPYRTMINLPDSFQKGSYKEEQEEAVLTLRLMESRDIPAITKLNLAEYGSGPDNFPGMSDPEVVGEWADQQALKQLVDITMRMKAASGQTEDHAIIVASVSCTNKLLEGNNDENENEFDNIIVGIIEVSRQPVLPNRIPSPVPIPLLLKQVYCQIAQKPLQAWIANLLVGPQLRGVGVGKVLVGAAEGLARCTWHCESIHLHCDADSVSGKIPQRLYLSLGYRPPKTNLLEETKDMAWMVNAGDAISYSNSIYFIEGVPLLYLQKDLGGGEKC